MVVTHYTAVQSSSARNITRVDSNILALLSSIKGGSADVTRRKQLNSSYFFFGSVNFKEFVLLQTIMH